MSRDLTPKEVDLLQKTYNLPSLTETLQIEIDGKLEDFYDDEHKALARTYPKLGIFGFDFLCECRQLGILNDEAGVKLIREIERYFATGEAMTDPELQDKVEAWYVGQLVPGYYMEQNNSELALIIKQSIKDI